MLVFKTNRLSRGAVPTVLQTAPYQLDLVAIAFLEGGGGTSRSKRARQRRYSALCVLLWATLQVTKDISTTSCVTE